LCAAAGGLHRRPVGPAGAGGRGGAGADGHPHHLGRQLCRPAEGHARARARARAAALRLAAQPRVSRCAPGPAAAAQMLSQRALPLPLHRGAKANLGGRVRPLQLFSSLVCLLAPCCETSLGACPARIALGALVGSLSGSLRGGSRAGAGREVLGDLRSSAEVLAGVTGRRRTQSVEAGLAALPFGSRSGCLV